MSKALWHILIIFLTGLSAVLAVIVVWHGHHYAEGAYELAWAIFLRVLCPEAFGK